MGHRVVTAGIVGLVVLAGCSAPGPSARYPRATVQSPAAASGSVTDAALRADCQPTADTSTGDATRYDAGAGSPWWVSYAVISNTCDVEVSDVKLRLSGPLSGSGATWGDSVGAVSLTRAMPPTLFFRSGELDVVPLDGLRIQPGASVQVVGLVTLPASSAEPAFVPRTSLEFSVGGKAVRHEPRLDLAFCSCQPPKV